MKHLFISLLLFSVAGIRAQKITFTSSTPSSFPDSTWEYVQDPSIQGWNTKKLEALTDFIRDSANTTGMMVIHHGKVIYTFGDIEELSYIASCRKSVLAILYGPFVENGTISLNTTLDQLGIDDVNGLLPVEKKATVQNLLTARSGVYHPASYPGDERAIAPNRGTITPGSLFIYNNWDFNLAGTVFEKLSGLDIYYAVDSMLARPLHMEDWDLKMQHKDGDSTRSIYPAYPMWFSTRDMARIGYLMLHNGKWNEKQIISPEWVHTITSPFTSFHEAAEYRGPGYKRFGYGYLWWPWDAPNDTGVFKGAYSAQGAYGQFITVLPVLDLVIAHKTNNIYERTTSNYYDILDKLLAADDAIAEMHFPATVLGVQPNKPNAEIPNNHPPSDAKALEQYTGEYTNVELHVTFNIEVKDQKLQVVDAPINDTFSLDETNKDLFTSHGQKFLFQRSMKKKDIIGFSIQTKGLPDKPFVKIK